MRPKLLLVNFAILLAWATNASLAQNAQRPTQLRDSSPNNQPSLVTRAAPTEMDSDQTITAPRTSLPSLGDSAWTVSPAPPASSRQSTLIPGNTANTQVVQSSVVPAQYTSDAPTNKNSPQAADDAASNRNNSASRPLKPPTSAADSAARQAGAGTIQMLVSVGSSLAIVIALIVGAGWCYRKAAPKLTGSLPKQVVQVLGRTQLAPRQQLVLIRFGSKLLLVSNLQGEVRTLSEMTDPLEVDQLAGLCESAQPGSISDSFRSVLNNIGRNGS